MLEKNDVNRNVSRAILFWRRRFSPAMETAGIVCLKTSKRLVRSTTLFCGGRGLNATYQRKTALWLFLRLVTKLVTNL